MRLQGRLPAPSENIMKIHHLLYPVVLLVLGQPLLAGGSWQFQIVNITESEWDIKFEPPADKATVRCRGWNATAQWKNKLKNEKNGTIKPYGEKECEVDMENGQVTIAPKATVLFTYDRAKCSMTATNKGINFLVRDPKGQLAGYKLEKTDTGKPAKVTYLDEKTAKAAKTKDVLNLTQGDQSNSGFTTIAIMKENIKD